MLHPPSACAFSERNFGARRTPLTQVPSDHRRCLFVMTSPIFYLDRNYLGDFARRHQMASMFALREFAEANGLLSYRPSLTALYARAAEYVDRIAKGARPTDLPIEQPTKFELVLNLKTAKAIDITVPPSLLLRVDEVIE